MACTIRPHRSLRVATLFASLFISASVFAADPPLKAVPGDLVTDYHGIRVADPYRSLEDLKSPQTEAWAKSQSAFTREQLDRIPGLKALRDEVKALDAHQSPAIGAIKVSGSGAWFYTKRLPGESVVKLYTRPSAKAAERVLIDPEEVKRRTGVLHAINGFVVAPDGKHIAAVISKADAELGELQIINVASGKQVGDAIPAIWGETPGTWTIDSRGVVYARGGDSLKAGGEPFGKQQVYLHLLAGGPDRKLMGAGEKFGPGVRDKDWQVLDFSGSNKFVISLHAEGIGSQSRVYVAPTTALLRDPVRVKWQQLFGIEAGIDDVGAAHGYVYGRTFAAAPRYRVVRYDIAKPALAPVEVVPQQAGVIDGLGVARDGLYFTVRSGSIAELFFLPHGGKPGSAQRVNLPYSGGINLLEANALVPGVFFSLEGWTRESRVLWAKGTNAEITDLIPASSSKVGEDWVAEELACKSHDGAEVPMSVLYKRGLVKDGSHPTLMDGYGGYGLPEPAFFARRFDPWLQRGGVFVSVKPRGGGAFGREWYQAGVGPRKANTWKDMIACGESLIARGFTSANKLAIQGTSMGGVAAGMPLTERPDLFAVGIVRVGITEALRFIEATGNGPNHESEMGSVKTAEGVKQLLAMSTYHNIKDGTAYPAILITAGMNDNRVAAWLPFKTFARFSAATSAAKPVLLRVEFDAGHGVSSTADQRIAEWADRMAFMLWNMGEPGFQPAAK